MPLFGQSILKNMGIGAGIGAGVGFLNEGNLSGTLGGAVGGAALGAGMRGINNFVADRGLSTLTSTIGRRALGFLGRGAKRIQNRAMDGSIAGFMTGEAASSMRHARVADMAYGARRLFASGAELIGKNRAAVNKWGGRAAVAAGLGSASLIGSSLISSNNGY